LAFAAFTSHRSAEEGRNDKKYPTRRSEVWLLYEIAQWRVPVANSKKHIEFWEEHLAYQRTHREKFYYKRSRILKMNNSETTGEEIWTWIDEYENQEAYDRMSKAMRDDPEVSKYKQKAYSRADTLFVPGSLKTELWTEHFRVD
jgi:hypothetical protein